MRREEPEPGLDPVRTAARSVNLPAGPEWSALSPGNMAKEGLMNPSKNAPRRGKKVELSPESLETRALLTGGTAT